MILKEGFGVLPSIEIDLSSKISLTLFLVMESFLQGIVIERRCPVHQTEGESFSIPEKFSTIVWSLFVLLSMVLYVKKHSSQILPILNRELEVSSKMFPAFCEVLNQFHTKV